MKSSNGLRAEMLPVPGDDLGHRARRVQHDVGLGLEEAPVPVGVLVQRRERGDRGDVRVHEHAVPALPEPTGAAAEPTEVGRRSASDP